MTLAQAAAAIRAPEGFDELYRRAHHGDGLGLGEAGFFTQFRRLYEVTGAATASVRSR